MKTVPVPTNSRVSTGMERSAMSMRLPVKRLRCVANESPWM